MIGSNPERGILAMSKIAETIAIFSAIAGTVGTITTWSELGIFWLLIGLFIAGLFYITGFVCRRMAEQWRN